MRWWTTVIAMLLSSAAAHGQSIDRILAAAAEHDAACKSDDPDEILICARDDRRHRLPLPTARDPRETGAVAGEAPRASATDPFLTGCGIFAGQGRCSKREAEAYGYGRGRDPVTLIGRLVARAIDGDAEIGPPALPRPRN